MLTLQDAIFVPGAKVKGHIKLKIEENTSMGKLVEPFQIWHSFFQLAAILNVPFRPNWLLNLS